MARLDFKCMDCLICTLSNDEMYQLHDEVWLQAHNSFEGFLCVTCIETRLGRRLNRNDFQDVELNRNSIKYPKSDRLVRRINNLGTD